MPLRLKSTTPRKIPDKMTAVSVHPNPNRYMSKKAPKPSPSSANEKAVNKKADKVETPTFNMVVEVVVLDERSKHS